MVVVVAFGGEGGAGIEIGGSGWGSEGRGIIIDHHVKISL